MGEATKALIIKNCANVSKEELALALVDLLDSSSASSIMADTGLPLDRAIEIMSIFDSLTV